MSHWRRRSGLRIGASGRRAGARIPTRRTRARTCRSGRPPRPRDNAACAITARTQLALAQSFLAPNLAHEDHLLAGHVLLRPPADGDAGLDRALVCLTTRACIATKRGLIGARARP